MLFSCYLANELSKLHAQAVIITKANELITDLEQGL